MGRPRVAPAGAQALEDGPGPPPDAAPTVAATRYRPARLEDVQGHKSIRDNLMILVRASLARGTALPHMLFSGPAGCGKTTLALAVANEARCRVIQCQCDSLGVADLRKILQERIVAGAALFLDEIHRLQGPAVELLYKPLEDGLLVIGGEVRRLPPFTCLASTTHPGRMPAPLLQRFSTRHRVDFLSKEQIAQLVMQAARAYKLELSPTGCMEIASRAKGTPRRAVRLTEWVSQYMAGNGIDRPATIRDVDAALLRIGVGREGFDVVDRRYFETLANTFAGGPVGLKTLASALGEAPETLEHEIEPWLVREGYVILGPRGRSLGPGPASEE